MGNNETDMHRLKEVNEFVKSNKKGKKEDRKKDKRNILGLND